MGKNRKSYKDNSNFIDTAMLNNETYNFYIVAFEKIARSIFEWVNLPKTMNAEFLEKCLYYYGISTQKMHARGPMGLKELTAYKYIISGEGQVR